MNKTSCEVNFIQDNLHVYKERNLQKSYNPFVFGIIDRHWITVRKFVKNNGNGR